MIEVENLTKRYGTHLAVKDLTFEVPRGEVCGFLGPNGAGKSTTLRMLTGYLAPTEGRIRIGGVDALAKPIDARKQIGYMPEACPLYLTMRVREYLKHRAELKQVPRRQIRARVDASLEQAAVSDVSERIIGQLSKGYRQRVGLADALVSDPPLLVLDEPTAGLDPNQNRQVRGLITELAKDKTVIISTHILPEVEAVCDRVLIIHRGKLVRVGRPGKLRSDLGAKHLIRFEGRGAAKDYSDALKSLSGVAIVDIKETRRGLVSGKLESESEDAVEDVFVAIAKADLVLRGLRRQEASLEDVFAELTTDESADEEDE